MKAVEFVKYWNQYVRGDTAAFVDEEADNLVRSEYAKEVEYDGNPEYAPEVDGKPGGVKDLDAPHASQDEIEESVENTETLETSPEKDAEAPQNKAMQNAPKKK